MAGARDERASSGSRTDRHGHGDRGRPEEEECAGAGCEPRRPRPFPGGRGGLPFAPPTPIGPCCACALGRPARWVSYPGRGRCRCLRSRPPPVVGAAVTPPTRGVDPRPGDAPALGGDSVRVTTPPVVATPSGDAPSRGGDPRPGDDPLPVTAPLPPGATGCLGACPAHWAHRGDAVVTKAVFRGEPLSTAVFPKVGNSTS